MDNVELDFTDKALHSIAKKAIARKTGARGLRSICESILTDAMFDLPSQKVKSFEVTLEYAQRKFSMSKLSLLKVA